MEDPKLIAFLWSVVQLLVEQDFRTLESLSGGIHLTASDMEHGVSEYGRTLILPPNGKFVPDVIRISKASVPSWSIVVPLYAIEEGLSDLSLELTVTSIDESSFKLEIDGLHVL